jgi:hypothetical protein
MLVSHNVLPVCRQASSCALLQLRFKYLEKFIKIELKLFKFTGRSEVSQCSMLTHPETTMKYLFRYLVIVWLISTGSYNYPYFVLFRYVLLVYNFVYKYTANKLQETSLFLVGTIGRKSYAVGHASSYDTIHFIKYKFSNPLGGIKKCD